MIIIFFFIWAALVYLHKSSAVNLNGIPKQNYKHFPLLVQSTPSVLQHIYLNGFRSVTDPASKISIYLFNLFFTFIFLAEGLQLSMFLKCTDVKGNLI